MAKTSGKRAPGTSAGISIKSNGGQHLSHGAMKRFVFRHYAGHRLIRQMWSKGDNWGNDLDNLSSPKHLCKVLCTLRTEEFINYYGIIQMVSFLPPCYLCTTDVFFSYTQLYPYAELYRTQVNELCINHTFSATDFNLIYFHFTFLSPPSCDGC